MKILALSAPISWLLVPIMFLGGPHNPDGGFVSLSSATQAIGVVILVHVACVIGLVVVWVKRLSNKQPIGKWLSIASLYHGALIGFFMVASGPNEFIKDLQVVTGTMFGKQ